MIEHWSGLNWFIYPCDTFYRLVIRIRCDAKEAQCPLGDKFGCDAEYEARSLMFVAKDLQLQVHFYLKLVSFLIFYETIIFGTWFLRWLVLVSMWDLDAEIFWPTTEPFAPPDSSSITARVWASKCVSSMLEADFRETMIVPLRRWISVENPLIYGKSHSFLQIPIFFKEFRHFRAN